MKLRKVTTCIIFGCVIGGLAACSKKTETRYESRSESTISVEEKHQSVNIDETGTAPSPERAAPETSKPASEEAPAEKGPAAKIPEKPPAKGSGVAAGEVLIPKKPIRDTMINPGGVQLGATFDPVKAALAKAGAKFDARMGGAESSIQYKANGRLPGDSMDRDWDVSFTFYDGHLGMASMEAGAGDFKKALDAATAVAAKWTPTLGEPKHTKSPTLDPKMGSESFTWDENQMESYILLIAHGATIQVYLRAKSAPARG